MKYKIALIRSVEGDAASVPGLPGCWSQGATEDEALAISAMPSASISRWSRNSWGMLTFVRSM
jgi:hypothetical protein